MTAAAVFYFKTSRPFKSNICDVRFVSKEELNRHIASLHEGWKVQCDFCAKIYTTEGNLKNHIVIVHESKIPFQNSILDTSD